MKVRERLKDVDVLRGLLKPAEILRVVRDAERGDIRGPGDPLKALELYLGTWVAPKLETLRAELQAAWLKGRSRKR